MIPPNGRKHQYIEEELPPEEVAGMEDKNKSSFPSWEQWKQENPESFALDFLPSNQKREENTERLKKLSKWQAIGDALSQVAQVTGASLGAGEMSSDGVRPYQGNAFLERHRQRIAEDEERIQAAKQQELQNHIRNLSMYRGEKQADTNMRHQAGMAEAQRRAKEHQDREQREFQREMAGEQREFQATENQANRDLQRDIANVNSEVRRFAAEQNIELRTEQLERAKQQARQKDVYMVLNDRNNPDNVVVELDRNKTNQLYNMVIEELRNDRSQRHVSMLSKLYNLENASFEVLYQVIEPYWDRFDKTRNYVESLKKEESNPDFDSILNELTNPTNTTIREDLF